jgi:hypothetical protein
MYERFTTREMWEASLVYSVSRFEAYLTEVLGIVLVSEPARLSTQVPGLALPKAPRLAGHTQQPGRIVESIESFVDKILRLSPRQYFDFFLAATGIQLQESLIQRYLEVKATRDVIVHGGGRASRAYLRKAGALARAVEGAVLTVDQTYCERSMALLNDLGRLIARRVPRIPLSPEAWQLTSACSRRPASPAVADAAR